MTLVEAAAHVGNPVLAREQPGRVRTGEITEVDQARRLVKVRLRRQRHPYDHTGQHGWYAPCHLDVPRWWRDRKDRR
jgi:hypothetical protein